MRVLHICYSTYGGAAIAASRLHRALLKEGVNSTFLCCRTSQKLPNCLCVFGKTRLFFNKCKNRVVSKILKGLSPKSNSVNLFPSGIHRVINRQDADIVNLHWVCAEMLSIEEIGKIEAPIVWTLHDLWPLLGTRSYCDEGDEMHIERGFAKENRTLGSPRLISLSLVIDRWTWKRKQKAWTNLNIFPVGVSRWSADCARRSDFFRKRQINVIHNLLDVDIYKPQNKRYARYSLKLPIDKFLILSGGTGFELRRKGMDLLEKALERLSPEMKNQSELVLFGNNGSTDIAGIKTNWLGVINSEEHLALIYSAADVMCVPSRQETFGQTAAEALACGTPVVAFASTGLLDIVEHKKNGYMAEPYNSVDFAKGIEWVLRLKKIEKENSVNCVNENKYDINYTALCTNAQRKAINSFSKEKIANQYIELYKNILHQKLIN